MSAHDVKYPLAQRLLYIVFSLRVRVLLMFRLETPSPIVSPRKMRDAAFRTPSTCSGAAAV